MELSLVITKKILILKTGIRLDGRAMLITHALATTSLWATLNGLAAESSLLPIVKLANEALLIMLCPMTVGRAHGILPQRDMLPSDGPMCKCVI